MIVIDSNFVTQIIYLIPRYYEPVQPNVIIITNDDTKLQTTVNILSRGQNDGYNTYKFDIPDLTEGLGFDIVVYNTFTKDKILYRGKMFATAQETQKYKINEQ
jgi:hypothetical protein